MVWPHSLSPPKWGNFVGHADEDLLAFAVLYDHFLWPPAFYHAVQAIEKYLKALALSIDDSEGRSATALNTKWIKRDGHSLLNLGQRCASKYPYYGENATLQKLRHFAEFDQALRYPWVDRQHGNGLCSDDAHDFEELVFRLRTDIPIVVDDYLLGMVVRGHHHQSPELSPPLLSLFADAIRALRTIFTDVNRLVRWPDNPPAAPRT